MANRKAVLENWLWIVIAWIFIIYFYTFLTFWGLRDYIVQNPFIEYLNSYFFYLEVVLTGFIFGTLFSVVNYLTNYPWFRERSFGFNILIKSILYSASLIICGVIVFQIFARLKLITPEQFEYYWHEMANLTYTASLAVYFLFFILLMNFIIQINKKFSPGVLIDLIKGKYYHPRREHLIFLFLDLKGSTTIAEKLGHEKYSEFIKDCVHQLSPILLNNHARVYQYVGDEIVLHWKTKVGLDQLNCLNTFFTFKKRLDQRMGYFEKKYGIYPEFKAGMDTGEVTVTEIGDLKREIAFHGDVLNTASRLEKKCNEYEKSLYVTEHLNKKIISSNGYEFEFINDIPLRGKQKKVKFFADNCA